MRKVVTDPDGTAHFDGPVPDIAGKTGTASSPHEEGAPAIDVGWFAGWTPADDPKIAFAFRIEGVTGRDTAKRVIAALAN